MLESNFNAISKDMKTLVTDAQALLQVAATLTGEKAEEVRSRGMALLDTALSKAQEAQASTVVAGKEMVVTTEDYVKENPLRAITIAAGVGLLLGALLSRK